MLSRMKLVSIVRAQIVLISCLLLGILSVSLWGTIQDRRSAVDMRDSHTITQMNDSSFIDLVQQKIALRIAYSLPRNERDPYLREANRYNDAALEQFLASILQMEQLGIDQEYHSLVDQAQSDMKNVQEHRLAFVDMLDKQSVVSANEFASWEKTVITATDSVLALSNVIENNMRTVDPIVGQQISIKQDTMTLWRTAQQERAKVASMLESSDGVTDESSKEIELDQRRLTSTWERLSNIAMTSPQYETLKPYLDGVEEQVIHSYHNIVSNILDGSESAQDYTLNSWLSLSSGAMTAGDELASKTTELTKSVINERVSYSTTALVVQIVLMLISIVSLTQLTLMMQWRLVRPVRSLVTSIRELSKGNLSQEISLKEKQDEIGEIAQALDSLRLESIKAKEAEKQREQDQQKELEKVEEIENLAKEFDASISSALDNTHDVAKTVNRDADNLNDTAEKVTSQSEMVDQAAEQATHNVETVASASEELTASIHEINQQIEQSLSLSEEAVTKARDTSTKVNNLSESAERIDTVRKLITDIAEKTNLLALNAAIEAARAGEAGKGFNVVASEVKALAKQTSDATEEIDRQIRAMESDTKEVVDGTEIIENFIAQVNDSIATIASAAEEQSAATQEISRSVQNAAAGTKQVSDGMSDVRSAASSANEMASSLVELAASLNKQSSEMRENFKEFLERIRSK